MATRGRRARGVPVDGTVPSPLSTILITAGCCLFLAGGAIAAAIWNHLSPDVYADWMTDGIAAIATSLCLYAVASTIRSRTILYADRIELIGVFRSRTERRDDIIGYRLGQGMIKLCRRPGAGRTVRVTAEVVTNPLWLAWLESLPNLDERDALEAQAALEANTLLGHTPTQRREAVKSLSKWAGRLDLLGFALAGWALFWPHPYELAVIVNGLAPLVVVVLLARWPGVLSMAEEGKGPSLAGFWLVSSLAVGLRGMLDVEMIDWHAPLLIAAVFAVAYTVLMWRLDARGRTVIGVVATLLVMLAWGWGVLVLSNVLLDRAPPQRVAVRVVEVTGKEDKPTLTLEALAPSHERFDDFDAPGRLPGVAKVGAQACMIVYPGRLGWRHGYVGAC